MTRPLRKNLQNGWYHVFGRGLERRDIFSDDRDRMHFLTLLAEMRERYRIVIHAYVLMTNHYHTIMQTPDGNLSAGMQWLHGSHAAASTALKRFNQRAATDEKLQELQAELSRMLIVDSTEKPRPA